MVKQPTFANLVFYQTKGIFMYQGRNRLLQWTRAIFVLIVIALIGACGGSNSSGDGNSDGETTDGSNTDGGTSDGASTDGGNTNGGNTDGSTTGGGTTGGTTGGDLNITAYNLSLIHISEPTRPY